MVDDLIILEHRIVIEKGETGVVFATSPDDPGLLVAARTLDDLIAEIPEAIGQMKLARLFPINRNQSP